MSWFPVDDAFHSHPKTRKAGFEAVGLWTVSGSYCMAYLTDGFVPEWFVKEKPKGMVLAQRLVRAELWRRSERDGEDGFQFHDWKPECTKAYVVAAREKARQRKAKSRESQGESRVTDDVTDSVSPASCLVSTQSNPIQSRGGAADAAPNPRCPKHINDPDPPPCWACKRKREEAETKASAAAEAEKAAAAERRRLLEECTLCEGTHWVIGTDPAVKCTHQEVANT